MNIIFMGPPGSGKGTQSAKLVEKFNMPHVATGDIFRAAITNKTTLGIKAKEYIDSGKLVPDDVTCGIVDERLQETDCKESFLLDGFPRTVNQAIALDEMLEKSNRKIDMVINLEVSFDVLIERLIARRICKNCGASYHLEFKPPKVENVCDICGGELYQRSDDNLESAKIRLETYNNETKPLIDFYEKKGILKTINGYQDVDDVFNDIIKALGVK